MDSSDAITTAEAELQELQFLMDMAGFVERNTVTSTILDQLRSRGVITKEELATILNERDLNKRKSELLDRIQKRCKILTQAVEMFHRRGNRTLPIQSTSREIMSSTIIPQIPTEPQPMDLEEQLPIDQSLQEFLLIYNPKSYKLGPRDSRLALIINNVTFRALPKRHGALVDSRRLQRTLTNLGFVVTIKYDVTAKQFKEEISSFKKGLNVQKCGACIVAVMSHGDEHNNFCGTDYDCGFGGVNIWTNLIEQFNNTNCPGLAGSPKIFLLQLCRGDRLDTGVLQKDSIASRAFLASPEETPPVKQLSERKIPSWTDMLVCYSTLDGYASWRHTQNGTWFIQALCTVMDRHALGGGERTGEKREGGKSKPMHLVKMLNIVSEMMRKFEADDGSKQICPFYNIGFSKKFYFPQSHQ